MADQESVPDDDIVIASTNGRLAATLRVDHPAWSAALDTAGVAERVLNALARTSEVPACPAEFDLAFLADADVAALNGDWRGKPQPTNVLSFPSGERAGMPGELHLGSVVLAFGVMRKEAAEREIELADHTSHLILHGVLHLLGHDHMDEPDRLAMEAVEVEILAGLGVANPYGED